MPIKEFNCDCGHVTEELFFLSEPQPITYPCESCGRTASLQVSMMAKTRNAWGATMGGVNGVYDQGLGCYYSNMRERDEIAAAQGVIPLDNFSKHFIEDETQRRYDNAAAKDGVMKEYQDNIIKFDGNEEKAMTETFPANECLEGTGNTEIMSRVD